MAEEKDKEPNVKVHKAKPLPPPAPAADERPALKVINGKGKGRKKQKPCINGEPAYIEWPDSKDDGTPVGMTEENLSLLLAVLAVDVKQNEMTKDLEFAGRILESIPNDGQRSTNCITKIRGEGLKRGLKSSRDDLTATLELIAAKNKHNPAADFLLANEREYRQAVAGGDTTDYIRGVFDRLKLDPNDETQNPALCYALFNRWLVAAARAPFNTLEKADAYQGIIVFVGGQYIGKSRFFRFLVPDNSLIDNNVSLDPKNKDSVWRAVRRWGANLNEFDTTMRKDRVGEMKNFITAENDTFRKTYARAFETAPRKTFFFATINNQRFLYDDTGDRRYWPIVLESIDFDGWTAQESRMMWGQVMTLAFAEDDKSHTSEKPGKVAWWPMVEELKELERTQEVHKVESEEEVALRDSLEWDVEDCFWNERTSTEIAVMFHDTYGLNLSTRKIGRVLTSLMAKEPRIKRDRRRRYHVPPMKKAER